MIRKIPENVDDALWLVAMTTFRPFAAEDWLGFAGVESEYPMISDAEDVLIVIDGTKIEFYDEDGDICGTYEFKKRTE